VEIINSMCLMASGVHSAVTAIWKARSHIALAFAMAGFFCDLMMAFGSSSDDMLRTCQTANGFLCKTAS
jgi:hypothetical protein